jgi:hypothetical protein
MQALLESKGTTFIKECKLIEIISDKDNEQLNGRNSPMNSKNG